MTKIHVNSFVKRQTIDSRFSYYQWPWGDLCKMVRDNFEDDSNVAPGYRKGVCLVTVPAEGFYSGVVSLKDGDTLAGKFEPRREGEEPRKSVVAVGRGKLPAVAVEVVLYASTVLAEEGSNELPAELGNWEIISVNARTIKGDQPMPPDTLMANHFGADGGSATGMNAGEFTNALRESFNYWKDKALAG